MKREANFQQAGLSVPMKTPSPAASSANGLRIDIQWDGEPLAVAIPVEQVKPCGVCNGACFVNQPDKSSPTVTISQQCPNGCFERKHGRWQARVKLVLQPQGQSMIEPWSGLDGRTVERNWWEQ